MLTKEEMKEKYDAIQWIGVMLEEIEEQLLKSAEKWSKWTHYYNSKLEDPVIRQALINKLNDNWYDTDWADYISQLYISY